LNGTILAFLTSSAPEGVVYKRYISYASDFEWLPEISVSTLAVSTFMIVGWCAAAILIMVVVIMTARELQKQRRDKRDEDDRPDVGYHTFKR